jgi:putative transposase
MIDREQGLSVKRQCQLLDLSRSTVYYRRAPVSFGHLERMRLIDEIHLKHPFLGSRRIRDALHDRGYRVNRKRVQRLMRQMGIGALYPKRRTSQPAQGHKVYPYRLKGLSIERPDQVWAADVTYVPMVRGFLYLVAIIDWHSRKVLAWRLSNTLDADFCVAALEEALATYGRPEIFNTDQGCQFTSEAFTDVLKEAGVTISMDGTGRWVDNVFVERLWRSLKYEDIYLKAYESVDAARAGIDAYFRFYNSERRHQGLSRRTPDQVYAGAASPWPQAA